MSLFVNIFRRLCCHSAPRNPTLPLNPVANPRPFLVAIQGNVGAGKSTLLSYFTPFEDIIEISPEPVEFWCNFQGHNFLEMMYSQPERYAFLFQILVQLTFFKTHTQGTSKAAKVMERSLDHRPFVENLYNEGKLNPAEYLVLIKWFECLVNSPELNLGTDVIIYLRTTPETAFSRIHSRARVEESAITISYVQQLHELHEDWLVKGTRFQPQNAMVIVVNAEGSLDELAPKYKRTVDHILKLAQADQHAKRDATQSTK